MGESLAGGAMCVRAYAQAGQMGGATGNCTRSNGDAGTFTFAETQLNTSSFSTRYSTSSTALDCRSNGRFSGTRQ